MTFGYPNVLMSLHRNESEAYAKRDRFKGYLEEMGVDDLENAISVYQIEEVVVDFGEEE